MQRNKSPSGSKEGSSRFSTRLKNIFKKEPLQLEKTLSGAVVALPEESEEPIVEKSGSGYDIVKEAMFHELANMESHGDEAQTWQKCRLLLSKAPGGFMLEFYVPPKASKPRTGVFCFLIHEARKASILEMPDSDSVFIIKAVNNKEYMLAAENEQEMEEWLALIHKCMEEDSSAPNTPNSQPLTPGGTTTNSFTFENRPANTAAIATSTTTTEPKSSRPTPSSDLADLNLESESVILPRSQSVSATSSSTVNQTLSENGPTPNYQNHPSVLPRQEALELGGLHVELPAETDTEEPAAAAAATTASVTPVAAAAKKVDPQEWLSVGASHPLAVYPWFHGTITRIEASMLVLQGGSGWHGAFVIRQSETKQGEYVLTFNMNARSKHLRFTLNPNGECKVQHLVFPAIFDMIQHFKVNSIPLEQANAAPMLLGDFVISRTPYQPASSPTSGRNNNSGPLQRSATIATPQFHSTHGSARLSNGSIRITRAELLASEAQQNPRSQENQYAML